MISRLRAGRSIGSADRQHLHFRLLDLGLSQRQVVLIYYAYCVLLGAAALLIDSRLLKLVVLVALGLLTLLALAWLARRTSAASPASAGPDQPTTAASSPDGESPAQGRPPDS
jgi:hypothetical protein